MSPREPQSQSTPGVFGYIIDPYDGQEPGGPPLLDTNEAGILQTFFDNPNNLAPGFMSMANATPANSGALGMDESSFGWAIDHHSHVPGNVSNTSLLARAPAQADELYQVNQGMQNPLSTHTALRSELSEDVFAAATLLQNRQSQDQFQYPSISHSSAAAYEFPATATVHSPDQSLNVQYTTSSEVVADVENGAQHLPRGEKPLEFGTDEHFRTAAYQAPSQMAPDRTLRDSVQKFWKVLPNEGKPESQKPSSTRTKKQKTRSKSSEGGSGSGSEASESGGNQGEEPRKRKAKEGEESSSTNGGKRRQSTSRSKSKKTVGNSGVKKATKEAAAAAAAGKGHRENLTEEQKRSNHIQSEQKRRNLIKQGFEDLNQMVPELRSGGLSKSNMLVEAAKFLKKLRDDNIALRAIIDG